MISYFSNVRSGLAAYRWADLRGDAYGGVTTGILMLPISMGFGVMTGLGPVAGLHGSIAVGLFSAIFSGTRGLIVGPNIFAVIAMAIIVTKYTTTIGEALTAAMLAGVIQIILGMLKFGRYMSYMPYSLLAGFFTAAGILLTLTQIMPALGQAPMSGDVADNIDSLIAAVQNTNSHALLLVIISIAIGLIFNRFKPFRYRYSWHIFADYDARCSTQRSIHSKKCNLLVVYMFSVINQKMIRCITGSRL